VKSFLESAVSKARKKEREAILETLKLKMNNAHEPGVLKWQVSTNQHLTSDDLFHSLMWDFPF
jgi:hypothetical protein